MKILYVTTIGITMTFFKNFVKELTDEGHQVDIACNEAIEPVPEFYSGMCKQFHIDCTRSPFSPGTVKAIKQIRKLVEENHYDIVHCHTPIAAMCTRLACRGLRGKVVKDASATEHRLRVFYTAHGFHFYKGAPLKNWLVYYSVEWFCSFFTDVLITINKEDYALAQKHMHAKSIEYVPGVGIDVDKFKNTAVDKDAKRMEIGVPKDAFMLLSVGELNENKNHKIVLEAMAEINDPNMHYCIAGVGPLKDELEKRAEVLGLADRLHLLGYRRDCAELYKTADLYVHPSFREGLPVSLMEAVASGCKAIASDIRGCGDILGKEQLFRPTSKDEIATLVTNSASLSVPNTEKYSVFAVNSVIKGLYCYRNITRRSK